MTRPPTAHLFREIIKHWFWDSYDYLLKLFLANVLLFLLLGTTAFLWLGYLTRVVEETPPAFQALSVFFTIALLGPIWLTVWFASVGHFAELISREKDPRFREFFRGLRHQGPRCWAYFQLILAVAGVLLLNVWFYIFSPYLGGELMTLRYFLAGICFWLFVFVAWSTIPGIPIVLRQGQSLRRSVILSVTVLFRYTGLFFAVAIFLASLWVIGVGFKMIGALLFGLSGTVILLNATYDVLLEHEEEKRRAEEPDFRPTTWKEIEEEEERREKQRMDKLRYERTLKDVLKPWED